MAHCEHCQADVPDAATCARCGRELLEADELIGREVLGRYRIVRMLAEGGMGRVYLAEQAVGTVLRRVAIKVLRRQLGSDKQLVSRFSREAETLVRLTHPNTVQLFDFGALPDGTLGLVMEYVEGHSLARELLNGPLSPARVERLMTQACGALQEAHAHGIVHRDLKPDNMLVAERVGHGDFIKVLDFGIAKVSSENESTTTKLTQQGMIIGTPPYMSPEQFSGEPIDARSDIYSLGVIAYEMLTGRLPFAAKTPWEWASKHLTTEPETLPLDLVAGLLPRHRRALREALAKRADDRPPTVAAFLARFTVDDASDAAVASAARVGAVRAVASVSSSVEAASARPTLTETLSSQLQKPRSWLWLGAVGGLLLLAVVVASARSRSPRLPPRLAVPSEQPATTAPSLAASALPSGAALPPAALAKPSHGAREQSGADSAASHSREHRAARPSVRAEASSPSPAPPVVRDKAPEVDLPRATSVRRDEAPHAAASASRSPTSVPDDLAQRIRLIQSTLGVRVEMAVGQFQAAASRYASHPALEPVRAQLANSGEKRIQELITGGHCAQAQALFRALRSIDAQGKATRSFGANCPAPA